MVVDDEKSIVEILTLNLKNEGYTVCEAYDGEEAVRKAESEKPDLILLDVMLPNMDGFSVCKKIRETSSVPILMITAREEEVDKVLGLELGADDYITKPFSVRELLARVKANMRRSDIVPQQAEVENDIVEIGCFTLDCNRYELYKNGKLIDLRSGNLNLLNFFQHSRIKYIPERVCLNMFGIMSTTATSELLTLLLGASEKKLRTTRLSQNI